MWDIENERIFLEATRLMYSGLHYSDISIIKTAGLCIEALYSLYETSGDRGYLNNAYLHLQIYLNMGFAYESHQVLFDKVCMAEGINKMFLMGNHTGRHIIKLTRSQVRRMIGKWNPSADNPMKIGEVVDEIIEKVTRQEKGIYTYIYRHFKTEHRYELVIMENECFFNDILMKKIYYFDLPVKTGSGGQ